MNGLRTCLLCAALLPAAASAQQLFDRLLPKPAPALPEGAEPPPVVAVQDDDPTVLAPSLSTIRLTGEAGGPLPLPAGFDAAPYLGAPLTVGALNRLTDALLERYETLGRPVVELWVPDQDFGTGQLVIVVADGRVGSVQLEPGDYFDPDLLQRRMRLAPGDPIRSATIAAETGRLGRNPFREIEMFAAPGEAPGEADLVFRVSDRFPLRLFAGYENSGAEIAGTDRYFAGFQWGNVLGLDHQLSYQFTTGESPDVFSGHAGVYRVPFSWGHDLVLEAALGDVDIPFTVQGVDARTETTSWLARATYRLPLPAIWGIHHSCGLGLGFESSEYTISALDGAESLADTGTETVQIRADYLARHTDGGGGWDFSGSLTWAPGDGSDDDFASIRDGATSDYLIGRASLGRVQKLPAGMTLTLRASGQWTGDTLLPSELATLGGYDTVRGYPERDALGDSAAWLTAELRSPVLAVLPDDGLQFLGFTDWGTIRANSDGSSRDLASAGLGLRYRLGRNVDLRFDYGWALDGSSSYGHVGVVLGWN